MATHLIGVLGRKRSGKDTFAARLVDAHGYTLLNMSGNLQHLAGEVDPLIDTAGAPGDDWPPVARWSALIEVLGWEGAKDVPDGRLFLQRLGTGVRTLDDDFWTARVMEQADAIDGPVVVSGIRFPNELAAIHARREGWSIRIRRAGLPTDDLHISETALDDAGVSFVYRNDSSIEDLHAHADEAARAIAATA